MGIALDTNIFILAYDKKTPQGDIARELLGKNKEANTKIFISVVDVNRQIARVAARLRAEYTSLRTSDALHLASAIEVGAKVFITTDKRLPRKAGKLKVEILS